MNAHSMPFSKILSIDQGAREHYHVPKYQREYTWGKKDWERLVLDIDENEPGYFMGSIICVKDGAGGSPGDEMIYEVVDGQQRLTTLSLMMMAIYQRLNELREDLEFDDDEDRQDFENTLSSLRNKLVKKKRQGEYRDGELGGWREQSKMCFLRVKPSSQNGNHEDYLHLLGDVGVINKRDKPRYLGVRSMCKAFRFFKANIPGNLQDLLALVTKINQLNFVHIWVGTQADAFTLFETLNNRGVPLSATDIIKNKILAEMEKQQQANIDDSYDRWQEIISAIPDPTDQERFLRHFYNAFRWDKRIRVEGIPRAIKSKIIAIYERLIKKDAQSIFDQLCAKADIYGKLIAPEENGYDARVREQFADLARVNATPAYQVLLYLFSLPPVKLADEDVLPQAIELLTKYYVRRNVTDYPNTRELDQGHMDLVEACQLHVDSGQALSFQFFKDQMLGCAKFASNEMFEDALRANMYSTNSVMTRYLLAKLDETYHTREYTPDLWARNEKDQFVWTVEHVLPQTEKIPDEWVKMLAGDDARQAAKLHEEHVHRLGNLTMSGYNSKLSTASFEKKQALVTGRNVLGHKINIGYRNGLALNKLSFPCGGEDLSLADAPEWTAEMIDARTDRMVDLLLRLYAIEGIH